MTASSPPASVDQAVAACSRYDTSEDGFHVALRAVGAGLSPRLDLGGGASLAVVAVNSSGLALQAGSAEARPTAILQAVVAAYRTRGQRAALRWLGPIPGPDHDVPLLAVAMGAVISGDSVCAVLEDLDVRSAHRRGTVVLTAFATDPAASAIRQRFPRVDLVAAEHVHLDAAALTCPPREVLVRAANGGWGKHR